AGRLKVTIMSNELRTREELLVENDELRRKLEETNNIINAIRDGDVDALLVSKKMGDQIYILKGADHVYRQIVEEMQEGYVTIGLTGTILFSNKNFARLVQRPLEQVMGMSIYEMLSSSDQEILRLSLVSSKNRFKTEFNLKTADSVSVPVLVSTKNCCIDEEQFACMVVTDLTEQKRCERFMHQVFDQAVEAIIVCDEMGRIVRVNKMAIKAFGGMLVHTIFDRTIPLYSEDGTRFLIEEAMLKGNACGVELKYTSQDGKQLNFSVSAGRLIGEEPGEILGFLVMLADVTESRKLFNEITRLDQLHTIGQIAAGLGHEVRNPMTTVRGYLQFFKGKPQFTSYYEALDTMIEELDRANAIISEFLSLAKDKTIEHKLVNLNKLIQNIFPLIQADAFQRGNGVQVDLNEISDILVDEKEIRQCIFNLVRNSFEAMPDGGTVTLRTYEENGSVILAIQDEGEGIPEDIKEKLGTPFLTSKESGTGLGLSVCFTIAQRNQAKVKVDTGPEGTTFYLIFTETVAKNSVLLLDNCESVNTKLN
ncbi:MAG TPA: ATP-binding protein, partial [Negativicutes bacterium]